MIINRRYVMITIILVVLGISMYMFSNKTKTGEGIEKPTIPDNPQEDQEKDDKDKKIILKDEADESEEEEQEKPFKDLIVDTIKGTFDYFRKNDVYVVALGDSLTQGVGDEAEDGGYIGILNKSINKKEHQATFDNYGKRGLRTDQLIKRLEEPEINEAVKDANIILITIGANDVMQIFKENITKLTYDKFEQNRAAYENRLTTIFSNIADINEDAAIYLLGFYNPFEKYFQDIEELELIINEWNESSELVTDDFEQVHYIPIKDLFDDTSINLFADDNFHPNQVGYHRMAERVLSYITEQER